MYLEDWGPIQSFVNGLKESEGEDFILSPFAQMYFSHALYSGNINHFNAGSFFGAETLKPYKSWFHFLIGENSLALEEFESAYSKAKKREGKHTNFLEKIFSPFFYLTLLKSQDPLKWQLAEKYLKQAKKVEGREVFLSALAFLQNDYLRGEELLKWVSSSSIINKILYGYVCLWFIPERLKSESFQKDFLTLLENSIAAKLYWASFEIYHLLCAAEVEDELLIEVKEVIELHTSKLHSIQTCVEKVPEWQRALQALEAISANTKTRTEADLAESRVVWLVDPINQEIQPKLQKLGQKGWSLGRNIALKTLKEGTIEGMTTQDRRIASAVYQDNSGPQYGESYQWDEVKALREMVGHPLLFLYDSPKVACELVLEKPQLEVTSKEGVYNIEISEDVSEVGVKCVKDTPTRFKLIDVTATHVKVFNALGGSFMEVPEEGKEKLSKILGALSRLMIIHSDLEQDGQSVEERKGDSIPHVHLLPVGDGFKLEIFSKPFKDFPPYFHPGQGRENVIATNANHQTFRVKRKLAEEMDLASDLIEHSLALSMTNSGNWEWNFQTPESCLEVLADLHDLRDDCILEWPEGEKLKITQTVSFNDFSLRIQKQNNWFKLDGEVRLGESRQMSLNELLIQLQQAQSRFIPLSDGQFLAINDALKKRLKDLEVYTTHHANELLIHPLACVAIEEFMAELEHVEVDDAWKAQLKRLQEIRDYQPDVPSTLQAELRSYQEEGFHWLSQLNYWGVGACLADDMGLGKTLQAISLMLDKAPDGPSLVIAPSSVCPNWYKEIQKFAPTINVYQFGDGDRKSQISEMGKFDLLIVSYGLLISEDELFQDKSWNVICIDEAQAIKNAGTKRSKTVMNLTGQFRMLTTGTPVENHLAELWNLFQFLNPGLLGSLSQFNKRFALPIERDSDLERKLQLKRLINPFILRRRKNQVLDELPEKTEITLSVEMSSEETTFYENLRQSSLKKLEGMGTDKAGQQFQILAELTKLRQASCHPRLVANESKIPSSKLELFSELLQEILEGGHKVLIFSQFVSHLSLIRERIEGLNVSYQYLDGSTPQKKRQGLIDKFQAGEGDVFLISLKAGGVGLNLTAADYVIHMDPWWNPAVEDQATDRAHRIGQQRPVTVYRLVT